MKSRKIMFTTILSVLGSFAFLPETPAAPAPETPDPGAVGGSFNTADGTNALGHVTTGVANAAFGWYSLFSNTDGSWNTGVGLGTLLLNVGDQTTGDGLENTAVGAVALLFNTTGSNNTAVGVLALENNIDGSNNTAVGVSALVNGMHAGGATAIGIRALENDDNGSNTAVGFEALQASTTGFNNAAFGVRTLESNVDGNNNTAIGNLALQSSQSTSDHVAVGRLAGSGITTANNNVIIGHLSGVHSVFGEVSDRCFIENIFGAPVSAGTAAFVFIDSDGRLGTTTVDGADPGGFFTQPAQRTSPNAVPDAKQAMLNLKVDKLQATVSEQKKQIKILTTQLKEQAAQIQKVSAQLEVKKPAAKVVLSNP
jgi:hypothetical protein